MNKIQIRAPPRALKAQPVQVESTSIRRRTFMKNDDTKIAALSNQLASEVLQPSDLFNDLLAAISSEPSDKDFTAICTAIRSDYPTLYERYYKNGETGDVARDVHDVEKEAWFHIGVAVGRRQR
jgi:hypothetical protein